MGDPGEPREGRAPPAIEIPDLELPPPRASQSGVRAVQSEPSVASPRISSAPPLAGPLDDEIDFAAAGPSLDLELNGVISSGAVELGPRVGFDADDLELEPVAGLRPRAVGLGVELSVEWPTGVTPDRSRFLVDLKLARELAAFGKPPGLLLLTPLYALRVWRRRHALIASLSEIERATQEAERKRDALLADLAERLRPELEGSERFRQLLAHAAELAPAAAVQSSAVGARAAELGADARAGSAATAQLQTAEHARERAEARVKRWQIELRALEQQARARGARVGEALPADLGTKLTALRESEQLLRAELDAARESENRARAAHAELGRRTRNADRRPLDDAERARAVALAEVARAVLKARGEVAVPPADLAAIGALDAEVAALVQRSQLHLAALDTCDRHKVRSGWRVLSVAALGALGLAAWPLFQR